MHELLIFFTAPFKLKSKNKPAERFEFALEEVEGMMTTRPPRLYHIYLKSQPELKVPSRTAYAQCYKSQPNAACQMEFKNPKRKLRKKSGRSKETT